MDNNNKKNEISVSLSPEVAKGTYSNLAIISHSPNEFVVDFALNLPGMQPTVTNRMIMNPVDAKRLLSALMDNVTKYESQYGLIKLDNKPRQQGGTFNLNDLPQFGGPNDKKS